MTTSSSELHNDPLIMMVQAAKYSFPTSDVSLISFFFPNFCVQVNWTKSFNCPGVVGHDVVAMLNTALAQQGIGNVKVVAILVGGSM